MHCTNCGVLLPEDARFCAGCGKAVAQAQQPPAVAPPSPRPPTPSPHPAVPTKKGPNCFLVGCLGFVILMGLVMLISTLMTSSTRNTATSPSRDYTSDGWARKAVANETEASKTVGGFSANEKRLYHVGLQHIANQHQKIGSFTIGQVVGQEQEREQQRLSGVGAYKVVEQWNWCGDGLGQRAIVLSHNPNDLVPAFKKFLASLNGDRSKCITFEVCPDQATLDQSKSGSENYPDSELVHQWTHELQYTNNPNSGLEEWNFGVKPLSDGTHDFVPHVIHAANN